MTTSRFDIKRILEDPKLRERLIQGVVDFCCKLEEHEHETDRNGTEGKEAEE